MTRIKIEFKDLEKYMDYYCESCIFYDNGDDGWGASCNLKYRLEIPEIKEIQEIISKIIKEEWSPLFEEIRLYTTTNPKYKEIDDKLKEVRKKQNNYEKKLEIYDSTAICPLKGFDTTELG